MRLKAMMFVRENESAYLFQALWQRWHKYGVLMLSQIMILDLVALARTR